ncbi:MAG: FoF1 ATP synthase subunit delta/epsilon [Phycisphaerales bacterium]
MAGKTFEFRLITPQGKLMETQALSAVIPAHDGQLGVLPDRAAMVVKLGMGELTVRAADDKSRAFMIEEGFAQMVNNKLTVLSTRAAGLETLVESEAQSELQKAEAGGTQRDKDRARVKVRLARSAAGKGI